MTRHQDSHRGIRFLVDTIDAGDGRHGYQCVVDGKRPVVSAPCGTQEQALAEGIAAARAKIDGILGAHRPAR